MLRDRGATTLSRSQIEILYVAGCPNYQPALALVERLTGQLRIEPEIRLVEVADQDAAVELRFLGSPTVRVNGEDVERAAEERRDFSFSCRIYRDGGGVREQPPESWVRAALSETAT